MENLKATVNYYLSISTDFAIMINGAWGSGKTHYFKKHLEPLIANTPLINDSLKRYRPLHISLYGLKSLQEIKSQIFFELYPKFNNKGVRYVFSAVRVLERVGELYSAKQSKALQHDLNVG